MCERFEMQVTGAGAPQARVPREQIWSVVEYLSLRRTRVRYSYAAEHFTVSFLRLGPEAARRLMEEWAAMVGAPEGAEA